MFIKKIIKGTSYTDVVDGVEVQKTTPDSIIWTGISNDEPILGAYYDGMRQAITITTNVVVHQPTWVEMKGLRRQSVPKDSAVFDAYNSEPLKVNKPNAIFVFGEYRTLPSHRQITEVDPQAIEQWVTYLNSRLWDFPVPNGTAKL